MPNGTLNTSTIDCNYMNCCNIDDIHGGICTNLKVLNTALVTENLSIVPFVNQRLTN